MDTRFRVTAFGFRQTIFITTPLPTISTRPLGIRENKEGGHDCPAPQALKTEKRFQQMVAPCASSCQCSRLGVRSPDSCTQNLGIQHPKRSTPSNRNWRLLRTGQRPPPE